VNACLFGRLRSEGQQGLAVELVRQLPKVGRRGGDVGRFPQPSVQPILNRLSGTCGLVTRPAGSIWNAV